METLLNEFGGSAVWPVLLGALPLVAMGLWVRRAGRRKLRLALEARAAERSLRDVQAGLVAVRGTVKTAPDGRLTVEEGGARAYVEGASRLDEGTAVTVVGCATHRQADAQASYRDGGAAWVIDARGEGNWVSSAPDALSRAVRVGRLRAALGAALFAAGIAVAVASSLVAWRASQSGYEVSSLE
jgi:hypothetical protein